MKLYQLSDAYRAISDLLEEDDTDGALEQQLAAVEGQLVEKVDSIAALIAYCDHAAACAAAEKHRLSQREDFYENKAQRLRDYVQRCLSESGCNKVAGPRFTVSLRACPPSVRVIDEYSIPVEFWRVIPERKEVNKVAILQAFKQGGEVVAGVDIVDDKQTLSIR